MYLQRAVFKNVAPFGNLDLTFSENQVIVFSGINGRGKTTFLSYVADAFFELARKAGYSDVLSDRTKYYRVISASIKLHSADPSIVYLRFIDNEKNIDFIEVSGPLTAEQYDVLVTLPDKIDFNHINNKQEQNLNFKEINTDESTARSIYVNNVLTYFPADRMEVPSWMNDIDYKKHRYNTKTKYSNELNKNIEARTISDQVANWILDVVVDWQVNKSVAYHGAIYNSLNVILQQILSSKVSSCRFGIGERGKGQGRVTIVRDEAGGQTLISPSIFHLSSGEISSLVLFAEIIRQYDAYPKNKSFKFTDITGIVVIDEVDKHLHIKLQKEVIPQVMQLFPNIQFFMSSHSPFFSLGASEVLKSRVRFLDLSINGRDITIEKTEELEELYQQILGQNQNYKRLYEELDLESTQSKKLRILTEGNNTKYIQRAIELLAPELANEVHICSGVEKNTGKNNLKQVYEIFYRTGSYSKTLFVWDCDAIKDISGLVENDKVYKFAFGINSGNSTIKKGVENLFEEGLFETKYYSKTELLDDYGAKKVIEEFNKNLFCESMVSSGQKEAFSNFQPLIDKIKSILNPRQ